MIKNEFIITSEMIAAGLGVYLSPGRYEPENELVSRIFCAMVLASPRFMNILDETKLSAGEVNNVAVSHDRWRPSDKLLSGGPDLDEK